MKKGITLIELMVVIVVLGILTAIAIPNVKNIKNQATLSQVGEDKLNVQKGVDKFYLEKGQFPTDNGLVPSLAIPKQVDFTKLEPPYLVKKPANLDKIYYWIDYFGTVWASDIDSPKISTITNPSGSDYTITWTAVNGAELYNVGYAVVDLTATKNIIDINADNSKYVWLEQGIIGNAVTINSPTINLSDVNTKVVINAISKNGLQTVPVEKGYLGSRLEGANNNPVAVISLTPNSDILSTTNIAWSYANSTDPDGDAIVDYEWQLDSNPNTKSPNGVVSTVGPHTMKLRVKDNREGWSDWVSINFNVLNATGIKQIAAGLDFTIILTNEGRVRTIGSNAYGQLGDGTTVNKTTLTDIGLTNVSKVFAKYTSAMALMNDGTVKVWGQNNTGQLGTGDKLNKTIPTDIGLSTVTDISLGYANGFAKLQNGSIKGWGSNVFGELNNGNTNETLTPSSTNFTNVKQIAAGSNFTTVLMNDGKVKSIGYNGYGNLGNGTITSASTLVDTGLTNIKKIVADRTHAVALGNDGYIRTWGSNTNGEIGDGTWGNRTSPYLINSFSDVVDIGTGNHYTMFLLSDGTVKASGLNSDGCMADGTSSNRNLFMNTPSLTGVSEVVTGYNHVIVKKQDASIWGWGRNTNSAIGVVGNNGTAYRTPTYSTLFNY